MIYSDVIRSGVKRKEKEKQSGKKDEDSVRQIK